MINVYYHALILQNSAFDHNIVVNAHNTVGSNSLTTSLSYVPCSLLLIHFLFLYSPIASFVYPPHLRWGKHGLCLLNLLTSLNKVISKFHLFSVKWHHLSFLILHIFYLCIHPLIDTQAGWFFVVCTVEYSCGGTNFTCFFFLRSCKLISIQAVLVCISLTLYKVFLFPWTLISTCYCYFSWWQPFLGGVR